MVSFKNYTQRYDIFWRLLTGLSNKKAWSSKLIGAKENEPLDLLGPPHPRLIMHCLSEIPRSKSEDLSERERLEQNLSSWLLFECQLDNFPSLAEEAEFPDNSLQNALERGNKKARPHILNSIRRRALSEEIVAQISEFITSGDHGLRRRAVAILSHQSKIPDTAISTFAELSKSANDDGSWIFRRRNRLGYHSDMLNSIKPRGQGSMPATLFQAFSKPASEPKPRSLPEMILGDITELLQDQDSGVKQAASSILRNQSALPETISRGATDLLKYQDRDVKQATLSVLKDQSALAETIIRGVSEQLKDRDLGVQKAALSAFVTKSALPERIVKGVAEQLQEPNPACRKHRASVTGIDTEGSCTKQ
ncbi:hypothetical protein QQS21_004561 [Conoideocrella luteorostrata]|uniref:HEAT repeat domain-containing protein n=1 Tax=Conoideocrella luteorostrata TaxID=1105319 RepID=A0AAJ0FZS0_9HYPO|nr:hypothetical protein QQS21_004561 [Conoideocrella luteorostrata]